ERSATQCFQCVKLRIRDRRRLTWSRPVPHDAENRDAKSGSRGRANRPKAVRSRRKGTEPARGSGTTDLAGRRIAKLHNRANGNNGASSNNGANGNNGASSNNGANGTTGLNGITRESG